MSSQHVRGRHTHTGLQISSKITNTLQYAGFLSVCSAISVIVAKLRIIPCVHKVFPKHQNSLTFNGTQNPQKFSFCLSFSACSYSIITKSPFSRKSLFVLLPSMKPLLLEKLTKISANAPAHGKHILVGDLRVRYLDNWAQNMSLDMKMENRHWYNWRHPEQTRPWVTCFVTKGGDVVCLVCSPKSSQAISRSEWVLWHKKASQKWEFRNANLNRSMCCLQTRWASQQKRSPLCEQRGAIWNWKIWNFSSGFDTESLLTEFLYLSMAEAYHSL